MKRSLSLILCCLVSGLWLTPAPLSAQEKRIALLTVMVPADAVVEVDGVPIKTMGTVRKLVTPPLTAGVKYQYTMKATYTKAGEKIVVEKVVKFEPGTGVEIDLTKADTKVKEDPKKKDEPKKEEPKKEIPKKEEPKKEVKLDVPYVPTHEMVVEAMLKAAGVKEGDVVYDLGCGDGRIVITAVKKFKAKKGLGLELAPERVKLSKENAAKANVTDKVEIREGSVLDLKDVSEASVVTLYLFPEINLKLMPMLKKTLKPGSRIVSHDFDMGDWKPDQTITVKVPGDREHTVFLWTIPDPNKKIEQPKKEEPKKEQPKKDTKSDLPLPKEIEPKKDVPKKETIRVPYVPTPQPVVDKMLELAGIKEGEVVWDLGCGDGRIVVTAVKKFKAKKGLGLDLDPERVNDSIANAKKADILNKVEFKQGDVLQLTDVSEANVVTLYLLPEVNRRLMPVLQKTLKPGSRVVSHDFDMGDQWKPEKTISVKDEDGFEHKIHLWTIPDKK